jgi:hypothetical protein
MDMREPSSTFGKSQREELGPIVGVQHQRSSPDIVPRFGFNSYRDPTGYRRILFFGGLSFTACGLSLTVSQ